MDKIQFDKAFQNKKMAQVKISNSDSTKIIECCWPSNAGIRIANDIKRIIETFIPAGKITGARIYHRPLREFEEASVFFSCCPCSHHWWVEFAVNAPTSDDDPVNYFLVEKSQESIKISVNNVKWVLDDWLDRHKLLIDQLLQFIVLLLRKLRAFALLFKWRV